ncbi:MAG TPA: CRTAC1 family protein [Candidatus Limnocylindrales bacterium]|nr:CRTAC1 family protein [Candidatus Limnocylindrales bacterium]
MTTPSGVRRIGGRRLAALGTLIVLLMVSASLLAYRLIGSRPAVSGGGMASAPHLVEEGVAAGVSHRFGGDVEYLVGGGLATFDCDGNGLADMYIAGGADRAALFRNASPIAGALRFERVSDVSTDLTAVTGAYPLDIDGDRTLDLVVLRHGEEVVLRGLGDCRFERAEQRWGIEAGAGWTVAFSATWETADAALPTLAFGDYVVEDAHGNATGCEDDALVRPAMSGTGFAPAIALTPSYCTLSMLFSDWSRSGRRDLRVSNDREYYRDVGEEQLWRMEPGQAPRLYGPDDGWQTLKIWGMGIASQDITGDGYPEIYLTSQGDNKLQTLADGPSQPRYSDIALRRGATAHRPYIGGDPNASTAWHAEFADVNNDTLTDLFVSKGNVGQQPDYAAKDPSNLLIGQADGTFREGGVDAGIVRYDRGRGAALVDLNLDGMLDLVEVFRNADVQVWRNVGTGTGAQPAPMGHWLAVDLDQDAPNHDSVGAWVAVKVGDRQVERELTIGGGHASGAAVPLHFGLGAATQAEIRVTWPDGEVGPWLPAEADQIVTVRRGAPAVDPVAP